MPVHDVDMDPIGAGLVDCAHFVAELGEVGGQDRWSDGKGTVHRYLRNGVDGIGAGVMKAVEATSSETPSMT
jgi:hypothetical protein